MTVGFWGLLRVAEALGIGSPTSRVVAAAAFALSPRVLTTLGSISSETLPIMLAPWVLLPTILALRGRPGRSVRRLAGQAGVAVALMGAVNAIATLAGCLPAVIWWACHRPNRRWWRYTAWWLLAMVLAMTWWVVALVLMARISPPFLDFIESSGRDDAVVVGGRGTARHRQLDTVRGAQRHRGRAAGHRVGRHPGDLPGGGGRAGRAGHAAACPPVAGW